MMMERKRPKARGRKRRGVGDSFRCVVYDKVVLNASNNPFPAAQYLITCLYMRLGMTDSINLNSHTGDERSHKSNQLLLSGSISPTHPPLPNGTKFTCPTPIPPPGQTHHAHLYLNALMACSSCHVVHSFISASSSCHVPLATGHSHLLKEKSALRRPLLLLLLLQMPHTSPICPTQASHVKAAAVPIRVYPIHISSVCLEAEPPPPQGRKILIGNIKKNRI